MEIRKCRDDHTAIRLFRAMLKPAAIGLRDRLRHSPKRFKQRTFRRIIKELATHLCRQIPQGYLRRCHA